MEKAGKITRVYKALKIELDARPGGNFVIGAEDSQKLINDGAAVRIYQIVPTHVYEDYRIEDAGAAYPTRSGKGITVRIECGSPVLPDLFASRAQVAGVLQGRRSAAVVSAPKDLGVVPPPPAAKNPSIDDGLKRGFGDAGNPPRRIPAHYRFVGVPEPAILLKEE